MTLHDPDHIHDTRESTVVTDTGGSAGVLVGLLVALVIIGLIAWAIFGSGLFGGTPTTPGTEGTNPKIDVNINQPGGSGGTNPGGTSGGTNPGSGIGTNPGTGGAGSAPGGSQPAPAGR